MNGYGYSLNSDIDTDINDDDTLSYYASKTTGFGKGIEFSDGECNCSGYSEGISSGQGGRLSIGYGIGTFMACGSADLRGNSDKFEFNSD
jgi:hypothetical protein